MGKAHNDSAGQDQTLGAIKHPLYPPGGATSVPALANGHK
jgi:hypothetical protein